MDYFRIVLYRNREVPHIPKALDEWLGHFAPSKKRL
jgi:hypothetical protein